MYAGVFYYVTYTLVMCMILLNFLIGIIIDAFIEVKERFQSSQSVPAELAELTLSTLNAARRKTLADGEMSRRLDAAADDELARFAAVRKEGRCHVILLQNRLIRGFLNAVWVFSRDAVKRLICQKKTFEPCLSKFIASHHHNV